MGLAASKKKHIQFSQSFQALSLFIFMSSQNFKVNVKKNIPNFVMPSMDTAPALHMNIRSEFHSFTITIHLLGGDVNVRFYRLSTTFFARLGGMD